MQEITKLDAKGLAKYKCPSQCPTNSKISINPSEARFMNTYLNDLGCILLSLFH